MTGYQSSFRGAGEAGRTRKPERGSAPASGFRVRRCAPSRNDGSVDTARPGITGYQSSFRGASVSERTRSEEHTSELQSQFHLVCRLLLEKKKKKKKLK